MTNNNNDEKKDKEQVTENAAGGNKTQGPDASPAEKKAEPKEPAVGAEEQKPGREGSSEEEGAIAVTVQEESVLSEADNLKNQVEKLGKESALYKDKWLRAEADMDNYKKRVHKEKLDQLKYGYETIIREILPVVDNLERAIEYSKKHSQKDSLYEGVELTLKLLKKVIEGFGVNTISTVGQLFDPNFHEGLGVEESQDYEDNVIVKEIEKGYLYNDRLIRPAKVIVGKKTIPVNAHEQT
jgi:molecular chaperone GrpE